MEKKLNFKLNLFEKEDADVLYYTKFGKCVWGLYVSFLAVFVVQLMIMTFEMDNDLFRSVILSNNMKTSEKNI